MRTLRIPTMMTAFGIVFLLTSAVVPQDTPTLGEIVPANVHFFLGAKATKERARILKPYAQAVRDLVDSGIGRDIFDLATLEMSEGEKQEALAIIGRVFDLLKTPKWKELVRKETAFAFRLSMPIPEYLVLFRVPAENAAERRGELRKMLAGFAEFAPDFLVVSDSSKKGADLSRLEAQGTPLSLSVASKGDVVALSNSDLMLDSVLDLIDSGDKVGSLAKESKFAASFEGLDGPADMRSFFDFPGYMNFIRGLMDLGAGAGQGNADVKGIVSVARIVMGELARLGPIASTANVAEGRELSRVKIAFAQEGEQSGFIEGLVRDQKPTMDFMKVVPKDAVSFYMTSGVDLARIYDAATDLIREHLHRGPRLLERWDGIQARMGCRLRDDILAWMDGGFGWITLPTPAGTETVFYLRLRDEEKAREVLKKAYGKVRGFLASRGQSVELAEISALGDAFHEVRLSAFPWIRPVVGTPGSTLVVGTSASAVMRCLATFKGEAPSITENRSFAALGVPGGPLNELFYADVEGSLEAIANLVSAVGFIASILPENHDTRPALKVGAILTKLSAFLRAVDLPFEYATWSRYDAERHAVFSDIVTQFRPRKKDV